jgi:predicted nucleic acid-binding protein
VIAPGVLLDTGPIVALLSKHDTSHQRAVRLFGACQPPFRCCEAVVAEACHLMRKAHRDGPAEVLALGRKGVFDSALELDEHWTGIESLLAKYSDRPISLADACLIRAAEIFDEPRILTFDADFDIYRWASRRKFERIAID